MEKAKRSHHWKCACKPVGGVVGKSAAHTNPESYAETNLRVEVADALLPRKASQVMTHSVSVPQTDTGRQGEYPKALELSVVKELGKFAP